MKDDLVLRVVAKLLIPFILLFALYVQFHGDFGPGGGFQAGVILAAAVIFYALVYGLAAGAHGGARAAGRIDDGLGVLIYAGVGVAGLLLGGNFLDYFVLDHDPVHGQHRGIFWVEVGVAVTVSGVMLKIFYMFADRGHVDELDDEDPGAADDPRRPLHLLHHHLPDDGRAVHRHRARQPDQEAGRAGHLPDLGVPALHRARASWSAAPRRSSPPASASTRTRCRTC